MSMKFEGIIIILLNEHLDNPLTLITFIIRNSLSLSTHSLLAHSNNP